MPAVLERLRSDYSSAQDRYRAIEALLEQEDRDPNETEQGELDALTGRMRALQPRINEAAEMERMLNAGAEAFAGVPSAPVQRGRTREPERPVPGDTFRSWGEYASALARGEVEPPVVESVNEALESLAVNRAFVDVTTGDVPGLLPPVWLRDIVDLVGVARPTVEAFSRAPLPDTGMVLTYPRVTAKPLVGKQAAEKTDIASRKTTVTANNANVVTWGGGEDVSIQVIQRTDPSYLGLMLQLYAEEMAMVTNGDAITAITAGATGAPIALGSDPATWNASLADGVGALYSTSRMLPDTFVVGVGLWAAFAGASDPDGRPLFPNVSPSNPVGSSSLDSPTGNARGLSFVVDPGLPSDSGFLGNGRAFTTFLGAVQTMNVNNPSKLGVDYAVFQMGAFALRRPDAIAVVTYTPPVIP